MITVRTSQLKPIEIHAMYRILTEGQMHLCSTVLDTVSVNSFTCEDCKYKRICMNVDYVTKYLAKKLAQIGE